MRQLKFFYKKDLEKKYSNDFLHVKAYYIHHLLDFFKETRMDWNDLDSLFQKFTQSKVKTSFMDENGKLIDFTNLLNQIFLIFKKHKDELFQDLK